MRAKPKRMPELLKIASGQRAPDAALRSSKSSSLIFTLTWTVRLPLSFILSGINHLGYKYNDTIDTFSIMINAERVAKGKAAEIAFEGWLKRERFSYLAVCQEKHSFSPLFHGRLKRPDFLVLLESVGMIAVDVKGGEYTLQCETEIQRAMQFERLFRIPVWYAFWDEDLGGAYWISLLKAIEVGRQRKNSHDQSFFLSIKRGELLRIKKNADFGKLYTQRLRTLNALHLQDQ